MSFIETLPPKLRYKVPPKLRYKIIAQERRKNSVNTRKARDFSRLIGLIGKNNRTWFDGPIVEMIYRAFLIPQNLILNLVKQPQLFFGGHVEPEVLYDPQYAQISPIPRIPIGEFVEVILNPLVYWQRNTGNNFNNDAWPFGAESDGLKFTGSRGEGVMQYLGRHQTMASWLTFKQGNVVTSIPLRVVRSIRKSKKIPRNATRYGLTLRLPLS